MGRGVALQFKEVYPKMFLDYQRACRRGDVRPGKLHVFQMPGYTVVNFPTKRDWRNGSRIEDVELGLAVLAVFLRPLGMVHVTLPALGCGYGGLDWFMVRPLIQQYLGPLKAEIRCYSPEDRQ